MKSKFLFFFILLLSVKVFSQSDTLHSKLDSILKEADWLYSYEKAAWLASDIFITKKKLYKEFGDYLVYHQSDTVCVVFIDKKRKYRLALYKFTFSNLEKPVEISYKKVAPSNLEQELFAIKNKIIKQLIENKYDITIPRGFSPNFELLKTDYGYRFYIIMGTNQEGIIPFGNDYVFITDKEGNIVTWRKFHSRILPFEVRGPEGLEVREIIHSHLKSTPYITATDICTFRLYAPLYGVKSFSVYSTAFRMYFKYNLETNTIEIKK